MVGESTVKACELKVTTLPAPGMPPAFTAPAKTVDQRFVKLGQNRGDQIRVLEGLKSGDEVVTSGVFKLRQGGAVLVNNAVQPGNDPAPTPPNN